MTRGTRFISAQALADLVLTALILGMCAAAIRGASFLPWAVLAAAWVGGRFILQRRAGLVSASGTWLRGHVPELLLGALFLAGLTLRLWGIDFGSPLVTHPDEHAIVGVAVHMLKTGWFEPPTPFDYPTAFPYILLPAFALRYVRGRSAGTWTDLGDINVRSFEFYELARAHSAIFGALTILLTYVVARQIWPGRRGRWIGAIAATFVTFSFNHVKESHFAVTDATLTLFVVVSFLAILSALRRGSTRAYVIAGFMIGITCATKYSALPLVAVLVLAHFLDAGRAWTNWARLPAGLVAIAAGFLTGYPYALLNWPEFMEHLAWMNSFSHRRFDAAERSDYMLIYAQESGFGQLFTWVFGAAFVYAVHRRKPEEVLAVTFMVISVVLLSNSAFPFYPRYLVPLVPFAALLVGGFLIEAADRLSGMPKARLVVPLALIVVVAVLTAPQAYESYQFAGLSALPDTRAQARGYITEHFKPGTTIATEDSILRLPTGYQVLRWSPLHERTVEEFETAGVDLLVFSAARNVRDGDQKAAGRSDLQRRFPLEAVFPWREGATSGPTISVHRGPRALQ